METNMKEQFNTMNEQFAKQAEEFLKAARKVQLPDNIQAMSEEAIATARATYEKLDEISKEINKAMEKVSGTAQKGSMILSDKITDNIKENTDAVMAAVTQIANAKSIPQAAKVQSDFIQAQLNKAAQQGSELYELGAKLTKDATDQWSKAAASAMDLGKRK